MPIPAAPLCSCLCLILLFVSVCLCSPELRSLHHCRWKRDFNRSIKVLGEGVCRSVFFWLPKDGCAATLQGLCVFPMRPFHCWCAREHLLTTGPFHMPVSWLLASGSNNADRKMVCSDAGLHITWLSLFVCALRKTKTKSKCILLWQQLWELFGQPLLHWHRISHWLCGQCERIQRDCLLYVAISQWQYKTKHVIPHKCSPPPLSWNRMLP